MTNYINFQEKYKTLNKSTQSVHTSTKTHNNSKKIIFLRPYSDPHHSQNFIGSKLVSSDFQEDPSSSNCIILLTNKQTDKCHENNTSLDELMMAV